jgi:tetratricopeptide (TPR) repeat protein
MAAPTLRSIITARQTLKLPTPRAVSLLTRPNILPSGESARSFPETAFAYVFKSQALKNLNDDAESLKALDCAIEKKADYAFAWHLKGEALPRLGRLDEARLAFQKASKLGYNR